MGLYDGTILGKLQHVEGASASVQVGEEHGLAVPHHLPAPCFLAQAWGLHAPRASP